MPIWKNDFVRLRWFPSDWSLMGGWFVCDRGGGPAAGCMPIMFYNQLTHFSQQCRRCPGSWLLASQIFFHLRIIKLTISRKRGIIIIAYLSCYTLHACESVYCVSSERMPTNIASFSRPAVSPDSQSVCVCHAKTNRRPSRLLSLARGVCLLHTWHW